MDRFDKPYKGTDSFQVEDGQLFYGREAEAGQLAARILSSRFTLVHAQSGAGKTSLLNARVIPDLEVRGWVPVRVRLENDPIVAARTATLQYLLPPPRAELIAISRACAALELPAADATISDIVTRYDALPIRDRRKRELIAAIEDKDLAAAHPLTGVGPVMPYTCRLLRASIDLETIGEHWGVVDAANAQTGTRPQGFSEETPIREVKEALVSRSHAEAYDSLLSFLNPPGRRDLLDFFGNLISVYAPRCTRFGLVLILDQFEELFTRFVDLGHVGDQAASKMLPDWRLRWEFLEQLQRLHLHGVKPQEPASSTARQPMPIRTVISMRSEYLAQLAPLRATVSELDKCAYHLQLLGTGEASAAIQAPAAEFRYGYEPECYHRIIEELTKEERFVEPAHLQVVCEHLWNAKGHELAFKADELSGGELPLVTLKLYEEQKGLRGIMRAFLWKFLESLGARERVETVEILEQLLTPNRTRNIVQRDYLVQAPLRNQKRREELLQQLVDRTIVRIETRLGGQFVEITHEFLIDPVSEAIQQILSADSIHKRLVLALNELQHTNEVGGGRGTRATLVDWELDVLHQRRDEIDWPGWAIEMIYRNAISLRAHADVQREWAARLASGQRQGVARALAIIDEYLAANDLEIRSRAVAALAALEAPGAVKRLSEVALNSTDAVLRGQAEQALCLCAPAQWAAMSAALQARLDDPPSSKRAYALLGRLRLQGIALRIELGGVRRRLNRAFGLFDELRDRGWRIWLRGFLPASAGAAVGFIVAVLIFDMALGLADEFGHFTGLLLTLLAAWILIARTTPTLLHFDRVAGVAVDVISTIVLAFVAALALVWIGAAQLQSAASLMVPLIAMLIAARLVAIYTYGAAPIPFMGATLRTIAVGFAAIIASGVVLLATERVLPMDAAGWPALWSPAFAIAAGLVALDRPSALAQWRSGSERKTPSAPVPATVGALYPASETIASQRWVDGVLWSTLGLSAILLFLAAPHGALPGNPAAATHEGEALRLVKSKPETQRFEQLPEGFPVQITFDADVSGLLHATVRVPADDHAMYQLSVVPRVDTGVGFRCADETPLLSVQIEGSAPSTQEINLEEGAHCLTLLGERPDVARTAFHVIAENVTQRAKALLRLASGEPKLGPVSIELLLTQP